jgi:hypothetical protein
MSPRFPDCPNETPDACRFRVYGGFSTAMAWYPEYDRSGKVLDSDPNIHTDEISCSACKNRWTRKRQSGETTFHLVVPPETNLIPGAITIIRYSDLKPVIVSSEDVLTSSVRSNPNTGREG